VAVVVSGKLFVFLAVKHLYAQGLPTPFLGGILLFGHHRHCRRAGELIYGNPAVARLRV
jgi:hypothetical protein